MSQPKFWVQNLRASDRGLHFEFANELAAHCFYLHLQWQGLMYQRETSADRAFLS